LAALGKKNCGTGASFRGIKIDSILASKEALVLFVASRNRQKGGSLGAGGNLAQQRGRKYSILRKRGTGTSTRKSLLEGQNKSAMRVRKGYATRTLSHSSPKPE